MARSATPSPDKGMRYRRDVRHEAINAAIYIQNATNETRNAIGLQIDYFRQRRQVTVVTEKDKLLYTDTDETSHCGD